MTRAQEKLARQRGAALDNHITNSPGPFDAASLSRSYGVDLAEVERVLKMKGKTNG